MDGHREHIVGDRVVGLLVEVVTDARSVSQQLLDRHLVIDQWQVLGQQRTSGGGWLELAFLDQAHHRQGGQPLGAAGNRELGVDRVGDEAAAMRETVCLGQLDTVSAVDADHAGEPCVGSESIDRILQVIHAASVPGTTHAIAITSRRRVSREDPGRHRAWLAGRARASRQLGLDPRSMLPRLRCC